MYLAQRTRFDILAPVLILSRFQKNPTAYCHQAAKRILRYLCGTLNYGIWFSDDNLILNSFVDSDYGGDIVDRKSMTGIFVKLGSSPCAWISRKQKSVALSTCEAEFRAMTDAGMKLLWIKKTLNEAGYNVDYIIKLKSDNQAAIDWAHADHPPSTRAKHIDIGVHFTRELVKHNEVQVEYIPTDLNDADFLTKPVCLVTLKRCINRLGMKALMEEEC